MAIGKVFTHNGMQAVRLPRDMRLPEGVNKVEIRAKGNERIIAPIGQTWDSFLLNTQTMTDDCLSERALQQQADREAL